MEIKENRITTDVYCKETDTHQYLEYRSCHPKHVKMEIPYGQALRIRRICELDEVFEERLGELRRYLLKRGFGTEVVDDQLQKASDVSRNT